MATVKTRKYKLNFLKDCFSSKNTVFNNEKLDLCGMFIEEGLRVPQEIEPIEIYKVKGKTYIYASDKYVWVYSGGSYVKSTETKFECVPEIFPITYDGGEEICVAGGKNIVICGKTAFVSEIDFSDKITLCNGVMFMANDNVLYFSSPFDYDLQTQPVKAENYIILGDGTEKILLLQTIERELLILTTNSVYRLTVEGLEKDYELQKLSYGLTVNTQTVAGDNESFYYIKQKDFCVYKNKKIKTIRFLPDDDKIYGYAFKPALYGEWYILSYYDSQNAGEGKTVMINTETEERIFLSGTIDFSYKRGLTFNRETRFVQSYQFGNYEPTAKADWKSVSLNLGSAKLKRIKSVSVVSQGEVKITISGDFGSKTLFLNGVETIKENLVSKTFTLLTECNASSLPITEISIEYQIMGEQ